MISPIPLTVIPYDILHSHVVMKTHCGALSSPDFPETRQREEDISLRGNKQKRRRVILVDGIRYYDDKPESCRRCFFWKNRKAGCILEERNCYYLAESVKSEQEKKCEGCCYAKTQPCVSACCYKELDRWLLASREMRREKDGAQNEQE